MALIQANDQQLKKVLGQKQPAIIVFHDSNQKDKPLESALKREAKRNAHDLLVIQVDVNDSPHSYAKYNQPPTPALVTLTKAFFGRSIKSSAENIRPADLRTHINHLLTDVPLPENKPKSKGKNNIKRSKDNSAALHVNDMTFRKDVLKSKQPVLVDFWADWCGPCQAVAPFVEQMAEKYAGQIKVAKLNIDQNKRTQMTFQVQSIPTFIMFENGQPVERLTGGNPRAIELMIQDTLHAGR